jgi:Uma2 family endonuclease
MNVQSQLRMDRTAFLTWVQKREERYELVDGRIVMMVGASRNHGRIVANLVFALRHQLDPRWEVIADFGLDAGPDTLRYPDIVVDRATAGGMDYTASEAALLIEVLPPSSVTTDLGDKLAEYLKLPSLFAYCVLSQDEPKAWVWVRGDGGFAGGSDVVAGDGGVVRIPPLSIELPLAEIYRGVAWS